MIRGILLADDSDSVRQVMGIVLRGKGYEVLVASNGYDAIATLRDRKIHLLNSLQKLHFKFESAMRFCRRKQCLKPS